MCICREDAWKPTIPERLVKSKAVVLLINWSGQSCEWQLIGLHRQHRRRHVACISTKIAQYFSGSGANEANTGGGLTDPIGFIHDISPAMSLGVIHSLRKSLLYCSKVRKIHETKSAVKERDSSPRGEYDVNE